MKLNMSMDIEHLIAAKICNFLDFYFNYYRKYNHKG